MRRGRHIIIVPNDDVRESEVHEAEPEPESEIVEEPEPEPDSEVVDKSNPEPEMEESVIEAPVDFLAEPSLS